LILAVSPAGLSIQPSGKTTNFLTTSVFLDAARKHDEIGPMISDLLQPRPEVTSGKIQGVIDIERVSDPKRRSLESRAKEFFESTFVTGELRRLISALNMRLNSDGSEPGLFLLEGPKGVGKSHDALVPLHLVAAGDELSEWLSRNSLEFKAPQGTRLVWRKFTDFPLESLWGVVGEELGVSFRSDQPPSIDDFRKAVGSHKLVLIFDELESGVRSIIDPALRQRNLNFLQMVSEESNRAGSNVALVASVYDGNQEPGQTLKRVARVELRFQDTADRRKILFHRLFAKSPLDPSPDIDGIIESYLNSWRRFGVSIPPGYAEQLRESYPFTPELLDVALVRVRAKGGFQGTRGALGFLAALVRARANATHLITLADASLADHELRTWLADLDPSQNLITCAESNFQEMKTMPFADRIASAVLLASLAPSARESGLTSDELARQALGPDADFNEFQISLTNFKKFGSYFHERGGCFFFDTRENAHSKVNLRSLSINEDEARDRVASWWCNDILRDQDAVIFTDPTTVQQSLDARLGSDIRLVVSPRPLSSEQIHQLFFGLRRRNTVMLIEPRDERVDLHNNADLLKYARNTIAAERLAQAADDAARRDEFTRIGNEDKKNAIDYLRKTNFAFIQVLHYGTSAADSEFQRENLPAAASREQIIHHVLRQLYPPTYVQEHLSGRANELVGRKVVKVEEEYRNTPGFPMLLAQTVFQEAIRNLVSLGSVIGLEHPAEPQGRVCGRMTNLSGDQLSEALICAPFHVSLPSTQTTGTGTGPGPTPVTTTTTTGTGPVPDHNLPPTSSTSADTVSTSFLPTRQQVRQEVARLLESRTDPKVEKVRIALAYDERETELSALPSFLRGTLSGIGRFSGEASLEFNGAFTKAETEDLLERLPDFTPGACRVTITIVAQ